MQGSPRCSSMSLELLERRQEGMPPVRCTPSAVSVVRERLAMVQREAVVGDSGGTRGPTRPTSR